MQDIICNIAICILCLISLTGCGKDDYILNSSNRQHDYMEDNSYEDFLEPLATAIENTKKQVESVDRAALGEVTAAFKTAMTNEDIAKKHPQLPRTASSSLPDDLKNKIEEYLEKSLADKESDLASENCIGKQFYFTVSSRGGCTVDIGDASGAVKDRGGELFSN